MFDSIASRYDAMNALMTAGRDSAWRRAAAAACDPSRIGRALDVGTGTGDLALELARASEGATTIVGLDFAPNMLHLARRKWRAASYSSQLLPVQGDAIHLPLADRGQDAVLSGFTLRNLSDLRTACEEFHRVLRPGGRAVILEITRTAVPGFSFLFNLYFQRVVPLLGGLVARKRYAYCYLPYSVLAFPDAAELAGILRETGFDPVTWRTMALGTVALHIAVKPGTTAA